MRHVAIGLWCIGAAAIAAQPPHSRCRAAEVGNLPALSLQDHVGLGESDYFIRGHLQQGLNANARNPANPAGGTGNSPAAGTVYRTGYLLNQLYLSAGKAAKTKSPYFDVGYQADVAYGTDYVFLQSRGLEQHGDGTNRWNSEIGSGYNGRARYGLAMPQLFLEVANDVLSVKVGHFYNILGHEDLIPTENIFYTSNYPLFFNGRGESVPVTGVYAQANLTSQWRSGIGFHRGQANWEDNNSNLNLIGMLEWNDWDKTTCISYSFDIGKEDDQGQNILYAHSLIGKWELTDRLGYVLNTSYGFEENVADGDTAHWYGLAHYLSHRFNHRWTGGLRYDFFHDVDGTRVFPRAGGPDNAPGVYQAITLGLNYVPCPSLRVRPEVRWDWFNADGPLPPGPFDSGASRDQFMAAVDMVLDF